MYISASGNLGDDQAIARKPMTMAMRPKPYLDLNRFDFDKSSLNKRLQGMVDQLATAITRSWISSQPIVLVRLVGHTDSTGKETYNVGLGGRRARAVEALLKKNLKALADRVQIVVADSPGETEPRADNRTPAGRAANRRVEAFITLGPPPKPPVKKPINWDVTPVPEPIIKTTPGPYIWDIPGLPKGKSLSDWLDEKLPRRPSWLRTRLRDAVVSGACSLVATLVEQTDLGSADKEALKSACKAVAQTKSR